MHNPLTTLYRMHDLQQKYRLPPNQQYYKQNLHASPNWLIVLSINHILHIGDTEFELE